MTRWSTINGNRVLSSTIAALSFLPKPRSQTPRLQNLLWRGFSFQPARRPNSVGMDSNRTEGEPVAEGLPEAANAIGDSRQNDRDGSTLTTANSSRVISSRRSIPGCQPIKSNLRPLAHTHPANYVRVHFSSLGVYKES